MTKSLLLIFLISLSSFTDRQVDSFNFPQDFYSVDFNSATVKTVKKIFGKHGTTKDRHSYIKLSDGPCIKKTTKTLTYEDKKITFYFSTSIINPNKFNLSSISIFTNSPTTFGKTGMRTGVSTIRDILKEYGQPNEKSVSLESDSIYIYNSKSTLRQYHFWFKADTKTVTMVNIEGFNE